MKYKTLTYNNKEIPILYNVDCCVVGGGTAGVTTAVSALLGGISVLVVEKNICLGGSQTCGLVMPMMTLRIEDNRIFTSDIIQEELKNCGIDVDDKLGNDGWFNVEKLKYVLEKIIVKKGGNILYSADFIESIVDGDKVNYIIVNTIQGLCAIEAKTFVDCTGDAMLCRAAGIETVAGDEKTGENQSISLRFEMSGIDIKRFMKYLRDKGDKFSNLQYPFFEAAMVFNRGFVLEEDFRKGIEAGDLKEEDCTYFQCFTIPGSLGAMSFNCPEIPSVKNAVDAIELSKAIIKGRESIERLSDFLIKSMPGFENSYVSQQASMAGIRESRRIKGKYYLTEEDYNYRRKFEDAVVKTAYPVDVHGASGEVEIKPLKDGEYFEIPYRCMVSNNITNVIAAGRCISSSFVLQSSIRAQLACRATGQAAGVACSLAVKNHEDLNCINLNTNLIEEVLYKRR